MIIHWRRVYQFLFKVVHRKNIFEKMRTRSRLSRQQCENKQKKSIYMRNSHVKSRSRYYVSSSTSFHLRQSSKYVSLHFDTYEKKPDPIIEPICLSTPRIPVVNPHLILKTISLLSPVEFGILHFTIVYIMNTHRSQMRSIDKNTWQSQSASITCRRACTLVFT